jgi:hypothetical protein
MLTQFSSAGIAAVVKTVNIPKLYSDDIYDSAQLMIWDTVEAAITIVAASIPVLRVMLRNISTSIRRGTGASGAGYSFSKSHKSSHFTADASRTADAAYSNLDHGHGDSRSDKSILGEKNIKRVDTVEIKYLSRKGDSYEMSNV